jgi:hypothetical protein
MPDYLSCELDCIFGELYPTEFSGEVQQGAIIISPPLKKYFMRTAIDTVYVTNPTNDRLLDCLQNMS